MSNYANLISDFPKRCAELLELCDEAAERKQLDVTLMVCIAMPSIVIPHERLKGPTETKAGHQSRDWKKFERAKRELDALYAKPFLGSPLWPSSVDSWHFKKKVADVTTALDDWPELRNPHPLKPEKTVSAVLNHIRNALAHGSIYTRGRMIEQIVLLSEETEGTNVYNLLAVAPKDFRSFLHKWLTFVGELKLPPELYAEAAA